MLDSNNYLEWLNKREWFNLILKTEQLWRQWNLNIELKTNKLEIGSRIQECLANPAKALNKWNKVANKWMSQCHQDQQEKN